MAGRGRDAGDGPVWAGRLFQGAARVAAYQTDVRSSPVWRRIDFSRGQSLRQRPDPDRPPGCARRCSSLRTRCSARTVARKRRTLTRRSGCTETRPVRLAHRPTIRGFREDGIHSVWGCHRCCRARYPRSAVAQRRSLPASTPNPGRPMERRPRRASLGVPACQAHPVRLPSTLASSAWERI